MGAGAAVSMAVAAVEDSTAVVAGDFTEVVAPAAAAVSMAAGRAADDHSAAVADLSAVSGAAPAAGDLSAAEDLLAGDDQGRLVFAAAHLVGRVDLLRVPAARSVTAGRAPTASME